MNDALKQVRLVALLEGVSFALLICVGMPLKYAAGLPLATRILGTVHGVLTLWFLFALARAMMEGWAWRRAGLAFVASLVPFGAFYFDRSLKTEINRSGASRL